MTTATLYGDREDFSVAAGHKEGKMSFINITPPHVLEKGSLNVPSGTLHL